MDDGFPAELQSELFWFDDFPVRKTTAFAPYTAGNGVGHENNLNCHKRMIEFLRKSWPEKTVLAAEEGLEREKCYRHMMNERMRREKQKQSYFALHSMLPKGTKNDKNSIVKIATRAIQELKSYGEKLERRNMEMEMKLAEKREREEGRMIRLRVENPSSGINSMLAVLNFLKTQGMNAKAIHTTFSDTEFSAVLVIKTQLAAAEVERALQITLTEVEAKVRGQWQEDWKL